MPVFPNTYMTVKVKRAIVVSARSHVKRMWWIGCFGREGSLLRVFLEDGLVDSGLILSGDWPTVVPTWLASCSVEDGASVLSAASLSSPLLSPSPVQQRKKHLSFQQPPFHSHLLG